LAAPALALFIYFVRPPALPRSEFLRSFPKGHPDDGETDVQGAVREVLEEIGIDVSQHLNENLFAESAYTYAGTLHSDRWKKHAAYPDEKKRPATVFHKLVRRYVAILPEPIQLTPENAHGAALTDIGRTCGRCEWMTIEKTFSALHAIMLAEFAPFMERADVKLALGIK
jgi:hypothetical protein